MRVVSDVSATLGPYVSLVASGLAVTGSPGPATVGAAATAAAFGLRRSVPYLLGSMAGTTLALLAVAAGLASVVLTQPELGTVLTAAAVTYLVWLAWKIATAPPLAAGEHETRARPTAVQGVVVGVANPKAYAALGALLASHRLGLPVDAEAVAETTVLAVLIVVVHLGWAVAGGWLARVSARPRVARAVNLVLAAALLAATVPLLLGLRA